MKKSLVIVFAIALLFASCSENWLTQYPQGSTIVKEQFEQMDNVVEASVMGIYSLLYPYGGDHDVFGQRSIDMYGDLTCGDMALKSKNYGWFANDEMGRSYSVRRAYIWAYYYEYVRQCNLAMNTLEKSKFGIPSLEFDDNTISVEEYMNGFYYGELLALRGFAYAGLQRCFCKTVSEIDINTELSVPIYTDEDTREDTIIGAPRSTAADVYMRAEDDLKLGIKYMNAYNGVSRSFKLEINADVAKGILAYSYLNKGDYDNALKYAEEVINDGNFSILPKAKVLTTGFSDVNEANWMWGQDVTVETTTALASFFGQCDIHSYSYAWAGDVKGIDANLYKEVANMGWDLRKDWWLDENGKNSSGSFNKAYAYAPEGKFFSPTCKSTVASSGIDRDWLCDNVYMRIELMYLIAAEAAAKKAAPDYDKARNYLFAITDERAADSKAAEYAAWKTTLSGSAELLEAIRYNWRVELWGEGYGLQTFRRWGKAVTLGENHLTRGKSTLDPTAAYCTFRIPTNETTYNPYMRNATELSKDD